MFHSIRWRLVASFVLVTLLTVGLIGVLALSLFKQQTVRQEMDYLSANADAVARQALPLLQPVLHEASLQELARTSAFLSNTRVRILDPNKDVVADSGAEGEEYQYVWVASDLSLGPSFPRFNQAAGPIILALPLDRPLALPFMRVEGLLSSGELVPGMEVTVIRQHRTPWGSRVVFETKVVPENPANLLPELARDNESPAIVNRSSQSIVYPIGDEANPYGYVELSGGLDFGGESMNTARRAFILAGLGASLLALVVGLAVSRGLAAPITGLSEAAGRMSAGDLSVRAPAGRKDEIGQLADQFNRMAARLEASFAELATERDSLRRFIADASHELRTPITALRSFNELLQGPAASDADARAEFLAESRVQINRLEWITHNLLNLSRLEAGLVELDLSSQDMGEVLEAAAAPYRTAALEKGVGLAVEIPGVAVEWACDRPQVEIALSNLLDNALKFTPPGGQVTMSGEGHGDTVHLWVQDTGIGIDPDDQEHIFERFYQGRNHNAESSGLGLAIVQGIVHAHGGTVCVQSEPGVGSRFTIELPARGQDLPS